MGNCEEEAGNLCPRGYVTANESEHDHPVVYSTSNAYGNTTYVGHTVRGHMLIKCR
jgi:hypothetical protein